MGRQGATARRRRRPRGMTNAGAAGPRADGPAMPAHVLVRTGDARFALPVAVARRVVPLGSTARLPGTPDHVAGAMNVEGRIIAVWDLARCAGVGRVAADEGWVLVVEHDGHALGLLVDEVEDIHRVQDADLVESDEGLPAAARRFIAGRILSTGTPEPVDPATVDPVDDGGDSLLGRLHADALGDSGLLAGLEGIAPRPSVFLGPDDEPVHLIALERLTDPAVMDRLPDDGTATPEGRR